MDRFDVGPILQGQMRIANLKVHITLLLLVLEVCRGHGGIVVTLLPPTSEAGVRFPTRPQVGKLVVACRWSAVYSTLTNCMYWFPLPFQLPIMI